MRAVSNGTVLADSEHTVVVEGNHYFPPDSVRWEHLRPSRLRTLCPWKGIATYHHGVVGGHEIPNVAWTYRRPLPFARRIRGHVAFAPGLLDDVAPHEHQVR
ncbi:MAG: DUF427 domain-containing protein [Acidimicrobiales bacterium]